MNIEYDIDRAREEVLKRVVMTEHEVVTLMEACGRVVSRDIYSPIDVPGFDRSSFDGYAVRKRDVSDLESGICVALNVVGNIQAGVSFEGTTLPASTVRLMTGAPIPSGYDEVVKKEDTDEAFPIVEIYRLSQKKHSIQRSGDDIREGELFAVNGTLLKSGHIGAFAAMGICEAEVYKKPKIAVISTGSELVLPGERLQKGKIYNSNLFGVACAVVEAGCELSMTACTADECGDIENCIKKAVSVSDAVITTGGVSAGDYDFTASAVRRLGGIVIYDRLAVPAFVAHLDGKMIFGLSGNPSAAFMSFDTVAKPFIKKMAGRLDFEPLRAKGYLKKAFLYRGHGRRYLRSLAEFEDGVYRVTVGKIPRRSNLKSMACDNVYVDIPEGTEFLDEGEEVDIVFT